MEFLRIVALGLGAAIAFGIAHDLVTAHVCVEYFTLGHPRIIDSESPVVLALVWGVVATWWVGLPLGLVLAWACRAGRTPTWDARRLARPLGGLLATMAVAALLAGLAANAFRPEGVEFLVGAVARRLPADRRVPFLAAAFAHAASYVVGAVGGLALAVRIAWKRRNRVAGEVRSAP